MDKLANAIVRNQNLISSINQPLAIIGLEKIGQRVAGKLLTPVVWVINYGVNERAPDKIDVSLFGIGLMGSIAGPAAIATSVVKAIIDDDMGSRLRVARNSEESEVRPYIQPCYQFGSAPPQINAMNIASIGGTAWQHANGLWVYITDANNHHIPNYKPQAQATHVYQPVWPLKPMGGGKFRYTISK